ncbi:MAG TPA: glycoside hydrolase family 2, partial [Ruminococcus sp.]|nr:glycoside hydrolase family 2 [Ruminococcus sp.]
EYCFESLPDIKTVLAFAEREDLDLCGNVIDAHQKCAQGNEKVMYYLAQMVNYPYDFERLIYCSQLVQADCIRSNVEHMRRNRGRCMGSLYWQLNDSNPVISWSSIDYDNRWKALHYYAKRFYAPILLTAGAMGEPIFNISNETMENINGIIRWSIRNAKSEIMQSGEIVAEVPAMSAKFFDRIQGLDEYYTPENRRKYYFAYEFESNGEILSKGTSLLTVPKQFEFIKPEIKTELRKLPEHYILSVQSDVFVQAVELDCRNFDIPFSDNWFSLNGGETVLVTFPKDERLTLDILWNELIVRC